MERSYYYSSIYGTHACMGESAVRQLILDNNWSTTEHTNGVITVVTDRKLRRTFTPCDLVK